MSKKTDLLLKLYFMILTILITFAIGMVIIDFYKDYQCSTTNNIGWYYKNNCQKYNR